MRLFRAAFKHIALLSRNKSTKCVEKSREGGRKEGRRRKEGILTIVPVCLLINIIQRLKVFVPKPSSNADERRVQADSGVDHGA